MDCLVRGLLVRAITAVRRGSLHPNGNVKVSSTMRCPETYPKDHASSLMMTLGLRPDFIKLPYVSRQSSTLHDLENAFSQVIAALFWSGTGITHNSITRRPFGYSLSTKILIFRKEIPSTQSSLATPRNLSQD